MKRNIYILALTAVLGLGSLALSSCDGGGRGEEFVMRAEITAISEGELSVEVIEAPHGNTGPFFVIVSEGIPVFGGEGERLSLSSLEVGEVIEITYGGQVMMSYPPKIAARRIVKV